MSTGASNRYIRGLGAEVIGDHDIALSYVLERCPEALPSFAGLLPELQAICTRRKACLQRLPRLRPRLFRRRSWFQRLRGHLGWP